MFHSAAGREIEGFGAGGNWRGEACAFLFHGAEECRELVEIVLAPFFVRVMMALGAFEARSEEELAEDGSEFGRFAAIAVDDRRAEAMIAAFGQEDFTHELIVRLVGAKGLAQPLVEDENTFDADAVRIRADEIGPFVGPVIGVGGLLKNFANEVFTFVG